MASTIRGSDNFDSAGGNAVKAWVNFNGTGTVAIRGSYNVSSITDNGTGSYKVNFTGALLDGNCSVVAMNSPVGAWTSVANIMLGNRTATTVPAPSSTGVDVSTINPSNGAGTDIEYVFIAVLR